MLLIWWFVWLFNGTPEFHMGSAWSVWLILAFAVQFEYFTPKCRSCS